MIKLVWSALFAALFACGGNDQSTPPDAGPPPVTVTGRVSTSCVQPTGTTTEGTDLTTTTVRALITDATQATGFRILPAATHADGSFEILDVPDATTYLLQIGTSFYATDQHVIDDARPATTRCTPTPIAVTRPTPITFALTGMAAFDNRAVNGDVLQVTSIATGTFAELPPMQTSATAVGATLDWRDAFAPALLDAASGDDLVVAHLRQASTIDPATHIHRQTTALVDAFETDQVTLHDGAAATVTGAFSPGPDHPPVSLRLDRPALLTPYRDHAELTDISVQLFAGPYAIDEFNANVLGAVVLSGASLATAAATETIAYRDPYPASWNRALSVRTDFTRWYRAPGARVDQNEGMIGIPVGVRQVALYTDTPTLEPVMAPPSNIMINDIIDVSESGRMTHFDGVAPITVSWQAAPGATSYALEIDNLTTTQDLVVAAFARTTATSITLPAALFTDNEFYVASLTAIAHSDGFTTGHIIPPAVPNQTATIASGRWRFSSTCGDRILDPGEECDGKFPCNEDCTTSVCGDGVLDTNHSEGCDSVHDTASCDAATCQPSVCGDFHTNAQAEGCDDGGLDTQDGCSARCTLTDVCGDHVTQTLVEACDDGGVDTVLCDADCTLPLCGDGHVNAAAGEECDDGNTDDTDHCSNACKRQ